MMTGKAKLMANVPKQSLNSDDETDSRSVIVNFVLTECLFMERNLYHNKKNSSKTSKITKELEFKFIN
jgi:hypothetical protein